MLVTDFEGKYSLLNIYTKIKQAAQSLSSVSAVDSLMKVMWL